MNLSAVYASVETHTRHSCLSGEFLSLPALFELPSALFELTPIMVSI